MFSRKIDLDKPFQTGERVVTTQQVGAIPEGAVGKVRLSNGLGVYRRYWVRFESSEIVGQIGHNALVRPKHRQAWLDRQEDLAKAAQATAVEASEDVSNATDGNSLGIPEFLLERSRAAKQRLLG